MAGTEIENQVYRLDCGGLPVHISFLYEETVNYFGNYLAAEADKDIEPDIRLTSDYIKDASWLVHEDETSDAFREFQGLMLAAANRILAYNRTLYHGIAFSWRGYAWIFTAPSGTGKTTQFKHWRDLFHKDIKVINGDKPLLEYRDDNSVWVHSSPWKGKEGFGMAGCCEKLGGIILLEQGDHNEIHRIDPAEAVIPLFLEFISFPDNVGQIQQQAAFLDHMLSCVPVWKLTNLGDVDSAKLTRQMLESYLEGGCVNG